MYHFDSLRHEYELNLGPRSPALISGPYVPRSLRKKRCKDPFGQSNGKRGKQAQPQEFQPEARIPPDLNAR